jgi:hypothetical protein
MSLPGNYGDTRPSFIQDQASRHPFGVFAMVHYAMIAQSLLPTLFNTGYYSAAYAISKAARSFAPESGILPQSMTEGARMGNTTSTQNGTHKRERGDDRLEDKTEKKRLKGVRRKRGFVRIQKLYPKKKGRNKKRKYL